MFWIFSDYSRSNYSLHDCILLTGLSRFDIILHKCNECLHICAFMATLQLIIFEFPDLTTTLTETDDVGESSWNFEAHTYTVSQKNKTPNSCP